MGDDGITYRVVEYEELMPIRTKDGLDYIPGMRRLELESGAEIIVLDNRLTIRSSGVKLSEIN
jgi:hypothetical protein